MAEDEKSTKLCLQAQQKFTDGMSDWYPLRGLSRPVGLGVASSRHPVDGSIKSAGFVTYYAWAGSRSYVRDGEAGVYKKKVLSTVAT